MKTAKLVVKTLDKVSSSLASRMVYYFLSNPRVKKLRDFEETVLAKARQEDISFGKFKLKSYTWGKPSEQRALLVHGWEGQAGNFGALIDILLSKGYQVKAFDAPSHGYSSKGSTHMFAFAEFMTEVVGEFEPTLVISHSFGTVTSMIALMNNPQLQLKKWLAVTTPHNFKHRLAGVQELLEISGKTMGKVEKKIEAETSTRIEDMNMERMGKEVPHAKDILIVHSKTDKILSIESARDAHKHLPQSRLIELDGLGHYSILWSEELKQSVAKEA